MSDFDVKKLAAQLDAAQKVLDEIRVTSGCEAFGPRLPLRSERVQVAVAAAKKAVRDRRSRTAFMGSREIFGEPAWDILLDLLIKQASEERVSERSTFMNAGPNATTLDRWLAVLEQNGLIRSEPDPVNDNHRLIQLTPAGYEGMLRYLESIAS